jgi:hypothetical protein
MASEPMTLVVRLRNPAWESVGPGQAQLDKHRAIDAMREAAREIERLRAALEEIADPLIAAEKRALADDRRLNSLAWRILNAPDNLKAMARSALALNT